MPLISCRWVFCKLCTFNGLLLPFLFFLRIRFFFNIIFIIFYFIEGKAEKSFYHSALTLFFNFIEFFFK